MRTIRGFTLVEVMVVIVVIAILATIGSFSYSLWRRDTVKTAIVSDLRAAAAAMEQEKNFSDSTDPATAYPATLPKNFQSNSTTIAVKVRDGGRGFCLEGTSKSPVMTFHVTNTNTEPQEGACP